MVKFQTLRLDLANTPFNIFLEVSIAHIKYITRRDNANFVKLVKKIIS